MFISLGGNCSICYQLKKYGTNLNFFRNLSFSVNRKNYVFLVINGFREVAYPFDWCKISMNQLISVLSNDFHNYDSIKIYKYSENHNSYLLKNDYGITFAHDDDIQSKINRRINRFRCIENGIYIRIELCKINNNYINKIKKLMDLIKGKLILIINFDIEINIENVIIYRYDEFSNDWQMNHIDWLTIFKSFI
jgi:hypothetical protein